MELEKLIANIHELRAQELQRIGTPLERKMSHSDISNPDERVRVGAKSMIIVPVDENLKLSYHFLQPLSPEKIRKLSKNFRRMDYNSEDYILAKEFDYVLQSELAESTCSKDSDLNCLRKLPGFEKGFNGRLLQEFLIDVFDLGGYYSSKYIVPVSNGFKINISYRYDELRMGMSSKYGCNFEENVTFGFKKNVSALLEISQTYVKLLNDEAGKLLCQEWSDMFKLISTKTEETKKMIDSYNAK